MCDINKVTMINTELFIKKKGRGVVKEKLNAKNIVFVILSSYMVIVLFVVLLNYFTAIKSIELYDNQDNIELLNSYKTEVDNIKNEACRQAVNGFIQKYEVTSYDGEISLQDFYKNVIQHGGSPLAFYPNLREACNISPEEAEKYNLSILFLTAAVQDDAIMSKYVFQYELHIKDYYLRDLMEGQLANVDYTIQRKNELSIISNIIELERDRGAL